jgi:hypothetical protein
MTKVYVHTSSVLIASNVTNNGFLTTKMSNCPCYESTNWLWILDSLKFIYSLESIVETWPHNFLFFDTKVITLVYHAFPTASLDSREFLQRIRSLTDNVAHVLFRFQHRVKFTWRLYN